MQTLSRLNRAHPGKDTTYVLDFVNDTQEILEAFKMYHTTAELADVTDPNLVYNLRAKLDGAGHYDDFEVERVVVVALKPNAKQSELVSALEPVVDRVTKRFHETKQGVRDTISEPARRDVLARLLKLNHERYAEEVQQGLHEKKKAGAGRVKGGGKKKRETQDETGRLFD